MTITKVFDEWAVSYDNRTLVKELMYYICKMKRYYLNNYNRFVNLVWLMIGIIFSIQFSDKMPFYQAICVSACIVLASYPFTTYLSTKLLRKAMLKRTMLNFALQFLAFSILATLLLVVVLLFFSYLEKWGVFPPSVAFSEENAMFADFAGSMVASLLFNFGFCGLRFYEENLKLQRELVDYQLQILKSQINPHFMFNVLNHIHVLMQKDVDIASELLLNYSEILRYQLYSGRKETVTLSDEVNFLMNYIEVEKVRWKGKIDVVCSWKVTDGKVCISPLLFTSFVENAFKHVSRTGTEKGYVHIDLLQADDSLTFVVENSKAVLKKESKEDSGIGLKNIRQRLDILYPEKYELIISDEESIYKCKLIIRF